MKRYLLILSLWSVAVCQSWAQGVSVDLFFDQDYFLPREELVVKVRITNLSGQPIELGQGEDWLEFSIEDQNGRIVSRMGPTKAEGKFTLESSTVGTKRVNLAPAFDLSRPGRYRVSATIQIPQWKANITTPSARTFHIISGTVLWEQVFGVPDPNAEERNAPELRKYALLQTRHSKDLQLYFRLSDTTGAHIYKIFPLGPMVSFAQPNPQLDKYGNLHLLYQLGPRQFSYHMINPEGLIIVRETHALGDSRPSLRADADGRIKVVGGVRRVSASDLPPPLTSNSIRDAAVSEPRP